MGSNFNIWDRSMRQSFYTVYLYLKMKLREQRRFVFRLKRFTTSAKLITLQRDILPTVCQSTAHNRRTRRVFASIGRLRREFGEICIGLIKNRSLVNVTDLVGSWFYNTPAQRQVNKMAAALISWLGWRVLKWGLRLCCSLNSRIFQRFK